MLCMKTQQIKVLMEILNLLMSIRQRWMFFVQWVVLVQSTLTLVLFSLVVVVHLLHLLLIRQLVKLQNFLQNLNLILKMFQVKHKLFKRSERLKDIFLMKVHRLLNFHLNNSKHLQVLVVLQDKVNNTLIQLLVQLHHLLLLLVLVKYSSICLHTCRMQQTYSNVRHVVRPMQQNSSQVHRQLVLAAMVGHVRPFQRENNSVIYRHNQVIFKDVDQQQLMKMHKHVWLLNVDGNQLHLVSLHNQVKQPHNKH